ncbi:MAG: hypothetical protein ABW220_08640 [Burkholderiaceae bacterium]
MTVRPILRSDRALAQAKAWVIWLLIAALGVYGLSSTLLQVLGPAHRHVAVSKIAASPGLLAPVIGAVQGWYGRLQAQTLLKHDRQRMPSGDRFVRVVGSGEPLIAPHDESVPHTHDGFQRHHHDHDDPTVIALDGPAAVHAMVEGASTTAVFGSAMLPMLPIDPVSLPMAAPAAGDWPASAVPRWLSACPVPLERPPQA